MNSDAYSNKEAHLQQSAARAEQEAANRTRIAEAAMKLSRHDRSARTTISAVAERPESSAATVYRRFRTEEVALRRLLGALGS